MLVGSSPLSTLAEVAMVLGAHLCARVFWHQVLSYCHTEVRRCRGGDAAKLECVKQLCVEVKSIFLCNLCL